MHAVMGEEEIDIPQDALVDAGGLCGVQLNSDEDRPAPRGNLRLPAR
jgi:hypothetical protein